MPGHAALGMKGTVVVAVSEPRQRTRSELLLPIKEATVGDDVVPPEDQPDDWLEQPDFDPAGRPL